MSEQKPHCIHECVCLGYCQTCAVTNDEPCTRFDCKHDNRSPTHDDQVRAEERERVLSIVVGGLVAHEMHSHNGMW